MILNDSSRVQFKMTVTVTLSPSAGTLFLAVDGEDYLCTWDAAATDIGGKWVRPAHTNGFFAGPAVAPDDVDGAIVLDYGQHNAELRLDVGGTIVAKVMSPIQVRHD